MQSHIVYLDGINLPDTLASRLAYWIGAGDDCRQCARLALSNLPVSIEMLLGAAGELHTLAWGTDPGNFDRQDLEDLEDRLRALVRRAA